MLFIRGENFGVLNDDVGGSDARRLLSGGGKGRANEQKQEDQASWRLFWLCAHGC